MKRINSQAAHPLHNACQTRALESQLAMRLPAHTLMTRAGAALARLARALVPHARSIWVACGPGNNGGDGLAAASCLQTWATQNQVELSVTWLGTDSSASADTLHALQNARAAGVRFVDAAPLRCDLVIDAVWGIGVRGARSHASSRGIESQIQILMQQVTACKGTRLCADVPSGLHPDTGYIDIANYSIASNAIATFTLTFITLKPGLFTAHGRDSAGEVWFDDLGASHIQADSNASAAQRMWLGAPVPLLPKRSRNRHSSHKGTHGDVWVLGGQHMSHTGSGMTGAAVLAARAALHAGAGRVFVVTLGVPSVAWDPEQPELMFRTTQALEACEPLPPGCWVCGCGGGELVKMHIPWLIQQAKALVLDADALNAVASDAALGQAIRQRSSRGQCTVLTPHPLEAARLLGNTTPAIQGDRLQSALEIARRFSALCVLKGSGTVTATPAGDVVINPSGNGRLASAGTGDVLAGMLGSALAGLVAKGDAGDVNFLGAVAQTVWQHGHVADTWPPHAPTLTANRLSNALSG